MLVLETEYSREGEKKHVGSAEQRTQNGSSLSYFLNKIPEIDAPFSYAYRLTAAVSETITETIIQGR